MKTTIRKMGNSRGVIIPKPLLAEAGLEDEAEIVIEDGAIVLRRPQRKARDGGRIWQLGEPGRGRHRACIQHLGSDQISVRPGRQINHLQMAPRQQNAPCEFSPNYWMRPV